MLGSFKGIGFRIFAAVLGVIALGAGIYLTFIQSAGYKKATATIVSIEDDPNYVPDAGSDNDAKRIIKVKYTVDGKEYTKDLDSDSPSYKVGGEVEIRYDPKDPGKIHSSPVFGIVIMIIGGVILLFVIVWTVKEKTSVKKLKQTRGETAYLPSEKGEQRELYFITDTGTPKYGHRIEDKNRRVLYEAKMTKFTMTSPYGFDFIDHEHNVTTPHLVGHEEETDWNMILIDNHYTFTLDGEDIWKHLKRNGITVESKLASGKAIAGVYTIFRNGEQLAVAETTSKYVHEEDAEAHNVAGKIPTQGFYRIYTCEKNLDLLFVAIMAFARSGAADDKGGRFGMLKGTLKNG